MRKVPIGLLAAGEHFLYGASQALLLSALRMSGPVSRGFGSPFQGKPEVGGRRVGRARRNRDRIAQSADRGGTLCHPSRTSL